VSPLAQHVRLRPFTLTLSCVQGAGALAGELRYNQDEFDGAVVARLAGYFERFVAAVVEDADRTLGEVDVLGDEEREHLLFGLNQTGRDFPREGCVHQLFEAQAARTPDAVAVVAEPDQGTYRDLNERANQLAHLLRRHGVQPDVRVGLCVRPSVDMIVGLLGILKAGGAYVPLNPQHPAPRLAVQLAESDARVLVTSDDAVAPDGFAGAIIDLRRDAALLDAQPESNAAAAASGDNLVYVIYTSGSTGTPKGVGVRHRSLVNYTQFILRRLAVDGPLHFATVSTITADLGNTCIFPALASGGCLHVLGSDVAMEPRRFEEYVSKRPIDILKIVPSHLSTLLVSQSYASMLPSKHLILGGEALPRELVERIATTGATCRILNHYGPTEATVGCLTFDVDPAGAGGSSLTVPIGRPIANLRAYILDSRLRPVPTGVAGELYVGGEGLAAGYINDPAETAARFLPDPFVREAAARIYRTGDLARYLPDGAIEFLGRADHQVKVRGFRVEPGEIEAVLTAEAGVRDAVVVVRPGTSGDPRLVAYVTAAAGPLRPDTLRACVQEKLPDYMVPSAFVVLPSLPLTPNGKVDRAALPPPDDSRPDLERAFVAPRTPIERELSNIWASLLNVKDVGVHDNFFDLGGHSLLATRVVSQMRRVFALEIPLGSLFTSPTVAALAEEIERATGARTSDLLVDVAELEQLSDEEAARLLSVEGRAQ
jgi:amino acid adenylation domain-containing protein